MVPSDLFLKTVALLAAIFVLSFVLTVSGGAAPTPPSSGGESGIRGQVVDMASGEAIVGAEITTSDGSARALTESDGGFRLVLPPGVYEVHARSAGYIPMYYVNQVVSPLAWTVLEFAMILENPSPSQLAALEAAFERKRRAIKIPDTMPAIEVVPRVPIAAVDIPENITVLFVDQGITRTMDLEEYLKGVVPAEMPASWPGEALRAQAVAARSYAVTFYYNPISPEYHITDKHQAYRDARYGTTDAAVEATRKVVATHPAPTYLRGQVIRAFYFASCKDTGGWTKNSEDAWGQYLPYLRSVPCHDVAGEGIGGHGVGMSQWGARRYAEQGANYGEIIAYYYTGIRLENLTSQAPAPKSLNPGPNSVVPSAPLTLRWVVNGGEYNVQLLNGDNSLRAERGWSGDNFWSVGALPVGSYAWRAKAKYVDGPEGDWSPTWPFTVAELPFKVYVPLVTKRSS